MNLAIDLAIFERLCGAPLDGQGFPRLDVNGIPKNRSVIGPVDFPGPDGDNMLPSYGVRIPKPKPGQDINKTLTSKDPMALKLWAEGWEKNNSRQVPIFSENIEGRKFEDVWPCVTFYWSDMDFDPTRYIFDDPFVRPDPQSPLVTVVDRFGSETETGRTGFEYRRNPEPWSPIYTIRTYAKSKWENFWMCHAIQQLFPPRGALRVEMADGSTTTINMLYSSFQNMDVGTNDAPMSESPSEQRYYSRAFNYTVEGSLDNTVNGYGTKDIWTEQNAIIQRVLELADLRDNLLQTATFDAKSTTP